MRQLQENLHTLWQQNNGVLQWIPAHVGIAGNEAADRLAKKGSRFPQPHPPTTYREARTLLKSRYREDWRRRNHFYYPDQDHLHQLNRREQTTIFRLRTGHCGLNKHMKRMGLADAASCQCGADEQTPEHILQTCPHLEELRQAFWTPDASTSTKLRGVATTYALRSASSPHPD